MRLLAKTTTGALVLVAFAASLSCVGGGDPQEGPINLTGVVRHVVTGEGVEGVGVDALTGATPGWRRLEASATTDETGYYELSLRPQEYVIHPAVSNANDCAQTLHDVIVDVASYDEQYVIDFEMLPPPCP